MTEYTESRNFLYETRRCYTWVSLIQIFEIRIPVELKRLGSSLVVCSEYIKFKGKEMIYHRFMIKGMNRFARRRRIEKFFFSNKKNWSLLLLFVCDDHAERSEICQGDEMGRYRFRKGGTSRRITTERFTSLITTRGRPPGSILVTGLFVFH